MHSSRSSTARSSRTVGPTKITAVLALLVCALVAPAASAFAVDSASSPPASGPAASSSPAAGGAKTPATKRATFGIAPITLGKSNARGYFSYQMGLGGNFYDKVAVLNYGAVPLALSVFAADLANDDAGGIAVGLQKDAYHDAGGWIQLPHKVQVVTVPPTNTKTGVGRVVLPFHIAVPNNASPGDHGAAIVAVLSTLGKNSKGQNVKLDQRIATRMYLRVAGPLHPAMTIEGLKVKYHGTTNPAGKGSATVSYVVHNTGNVRLAASQAVAVTGLFGTKAKVATPAGVELLFPGSKQAITVKVAGVLPTVLQKARVTITPLLFQDQPTQRIPITEASRSFYAVPWTLLAILALVIALLVVLYLRRRRARRRPAGPADPGRHSGPKGPRGGPVGPGGSTASTTTERIGS